MYIWVFHVWPLDDVDNDTVDDNESDDDKSDFCLLVENSFASSQKHMKKYPSSYLWLRWNDQTIVTDREPETILTRRGENDTRIRDCSRSNSKVSFCSFSFCNIFQLLLPYSIVAVRVGIRGREKEREKERRCASCHNKFKRRKVDTQSSELANRVCVYYVFCVLLSRAQFISICKIGLRLICLCCFFFDVFAHNLHRFENEIFDANFVLTEKINKKLNDNEEEMRDWNRHTDW